MTGLDFDEAAQRLAQAGFKAEQGEQRYNNSAPKGTVLEQSLPPGTREGLGSKITLVVSGGQRMVAVPTVTGMTRIEAQVLLEKEGFDVGDVTEAPSNAPRGTVIGTRPSAGTGVSIPSTVGIILSGGAPAPSMPDVMGREVGAARQLLTQIGVRNVQIVRDPNGLGAPGTVVGQTPVGGAPIAAGTTVQLRVVGEPIVEQAPEPAPPPVQQP